MGRLGESFEDWLEFPGFFICLFEIRHHALKFFWAMFGQWFKVTSIFGELGLGKVIKGICPLNMNYGFVVFQKLGVKFSDLLLKAAFQPAI